MLNSISDGNMQGNLNALYNISAQAAQQLQMHLVLGQQRQPLQVEKAQALHNFIPSRCCLWQTNPPSPW